jgi:hypothetical protein
VSKSAEIRVMTKELSIVIKIEEVEVENALLSSSSV